MEPIIFEDASFSGLKQRLSEKKYSSIWVLTDDNTQRDCLPVLYSALNIPIQNINISPGENHKNIRTCELIWNELLNAATDRKALLLNLGGGVIGDMGGFCATTFKRGIDFIQIPTTLLSMVDASVGGKLGIDFGGVKNAVGIFQNPVLTCIYDGFLKTLPERELRSGFAEVIKHALIADKQYWNDIGKITALRDKNINWAGIIKKSVAIKSSITEKDPKELGLRKILNFGHTIGHALESMSLETMEPLLHGEAVAIGMLSESFFAQQIKLISDAELKEISTFICSIYPYKSLNFFEMEKFKKLLLNDKKNSQKISFSLLASIGSAVYDAVVPESLIVNSLQYYNNVYGK